MPAAAPGRQTISVALCTYNGERYLPAQLASIVAQTRLPDEIVVCDDHSTDASPAILQRFAAESPIPLKLFMNDRNVGSNKNFEEAIRRCDGDLIALCDQDDLWSPVKLERCEQAFAANPRLGLVFSDGEVIDDSNAPLGKSLWSNFHFTEETRQSIRRGDYLPLVRYRFVTGATVMFRAHLRDYCFPIAGEWVHDGWMAAIIACLAAIDFIEEPLISYRRHAAQQVGTGPGESRQRKALNDVIREHWFGMDWHRNALGEILEALARIPADQLQPAAIDFARQRDFLLMRLTLHRLPWLRFSGMLPYLRDYRRRASGFPSMLLDFLLPKANSEVGAAAAAGFSALRSERMPAAQ
jgi:glycosyltransferase involved in cell wall biosynthesis